MQRNGDMDWSKDRMARLRALLAVADISQYGATKYAWKGWMSVPDGVDRYGDALMRHLIAEATDGPIDQETGLLHAAQVAWNALARLELMLRTGEDDFLDVSATEPTGSRRGA